MGCCLFLRSSRSSSSSSLSASTTIDNIRVVDLNGYVEEFDYPVSVGQLTCRPPKHFLFTAAQLLSAASLKPLKPDTLLEPGRIYFLLPASAIHGEVSPHDLASTVKRLTTSAKAKAKAKSSRSGIKSQGNSPRRHTSSVSPAWNSPAKSTQQTATGVECLSPKRSWTPILDPIKEMSFRTSESELEESLSGDGEAER